MATASTAIPESRIMAASLYSQVVYETAAGFYQTSEGFAKAPAYCAALCSTIGVVLLVGIDTLTNSTLYVGKSLYHRRYVDANALRQRFFEQDARAHGVAVVRAIKTLDKVLKLAFIPFVAPVIPNGKLTQEARLAREVYQQSVYSLQTKFRTLAKRLRFKNSKETALKLKNWTSLALKAKQKNKKELREEGLQELRRIKFHKKVAAKKIQRCWRSWIRKPDFTGPFGEWSRKYRTDFVAHAIWTKEGVEGVFKLGQVVPSEYLFRQQRPMNYEAAGMYGERCNVEWPVMDDEMRKKIIEALPSTLSRLNVGSTYLGLNYCGNAAFYSKAKKFRESLKDSPFYTLYEEGFSTLRDELGDPKERVDRLTADFYQSEIRAGKERLAVAIQCESIRSLIVKITSLKYAIYCGKNCIHWSYGNVAVIRGNGTAITNALWLLHEDNKDSCQVTLKAPYENDGRFFCMELDREDTFVLGPRSTLEPYRKQYPRYRIIFIEELTRRQRWQLEVPRKLQHREV